MSASAEGQEREGGMTKIEFDAMVMPLEDAYPLPWAWVETWTGTEIVAANHKRVVMVAKGRAGNRIAEERLLADWIVRCVNRTGLAEIARWWLE